MPKLTKEKAFDNAVKKLSPHLEAFRRLAEAHSATANIETNKDGTFTVGWDIKLKA